MEFHNVTKHIRKNITLSFLPLINCFFENPSIQISGQVRGFMYLERARHIKKSCGKKTAQSEKMARKTLLK
jgi:hypothetical protein